MKKLIVISVIFALVAGNVFAADVGGQVIGSATLVNGTTGEGQYGTDANGNPLYGKFNDNGTGFGIGRARLAAEGQLQDGTLGGWARLEASSNGGGVSGWGFAWWKPSDLIKLQIGANPDSEFGLDGVTRWNFYQLAGDVGVANPGNAWGGGAIDGAVFGNAFYGGWNNPGIILNITPVDALTINIGIPLVGKAYKTYKNTTIQAKYNIDGVGTAGITYEGNQAEDEAVFNVTQSVSGNDIYWLQALDVKSSIDFTDVNNDSSKLTAYFGLSSIENVGIDIGIGYKFGDTWSEKETDPTTNVTTSITQTVNEPLAVGVGVSFNSGSFGLKTRVLGQFMGSTAYEYEKTTPGSPTQKYSETLSSGYAVLFDILPSYAINDRLTFYFSAGIGIKGGVEELYFVEDENNPGSLKLDSNNNPILTHKTQDSVTAWHVNPYISITPSYWSATFFAGVRLESPTAKDGTKDGGKSYINWSVPIGIICSF